VADAAAAILSCAAAISIVTTLDCVCAGRSLSCTATVKLTIPLVLGVPEIMPVDDASARPEGSLPEATDHV